VTLPWGLLGLSVLLVLANAFFVATEMALVRVRPTRLKTLVEEGKPGAAEALKMTARLDTVLSATQLGVTLASLGLGWIGEPAFAASVESLLLRVVGDRPFVVALSHTVSIVLGFALITFLHLVVGELSPKGFAIQRAESTALAVATPMRIFYVLAFPAIWMLNRAATRVLALLGLSSVLGHDSPHSEDELRQILVASAETGGIERSRAELLSRALLLGEKTARQVLVPRSQVQFLDLDDPLEKNLADARAGGHTWLPVCRGNLDQVEGVVNVKDLLFLMAQGQLKSLAQVQRPVLFVPENVTLEQLVAEFRRRKRQMAIVVDEHGGSSGVVTLADVVAEVVGEIAELGRNVEQVKSLPGGRLELPGSTQLQDLEDRLEVKFDLEGEDISTIAGYLMQKLGRVPQLGDRLPLDEYEVKVQEVDGPRVLKVLIEPITPPVPPTLQAKPEV
jgi:CBS domain containing-hemolysin-like protein